MWMPLALLLALPAFAQPNISGSPVGCKSDTASYQRVRIQGRILLNKAFLPENASQKSQSINQAIELQIKHLIGYFRNTSEGGMNAAISAFRGDLKISQAQEVKYGSSYQVDDYLASRGQPGSDYTQRALRRGAVQADDPALLIPYESELLIADCTPNGFQNAAPIDLPLDPFLSFWLENKDRRKPRAFGPHQINEISNCFSSELAQFGNSDTNWFFWSPVRPHCQIDGPMKTYQPEFVASQSVPPTPSLDKSFFGNLKELKSTAIFGIIGTSKEFAKADFPKLKAFIREASTVCKKAPSIPHCLTEWDKGKPYLEPGLFHFVSFLKYLHSIVSVSSLSVENSSSPGEEVVVKYQGRFIDSKMPISGSIYFGSTTLDYGPRVSKSYVKLVHAALRDSDAVFYVGHAGLGRNFKIEDFSKLWKQDRLPPFTRERPMWVGIYNCEGFSYFGFDQESLFKKGRMDLFLTESSGTEAGAKFPLAQLSILNEVFTGNAVDVRKAMAHYVHSREFSTETRLRALASPQGAN